ncbi:mtDNA inheritance, partitioning of the mitochondrial organelle [Kalmusia sp. IMI 367209]|nr:mtDNA inheritance, partitioning of the mitochondrial organelle [Kalmusia sp. IMI 367209]
MSSPSPAKIDRQSTTPFFLRLFFKRNSFHHLDDFDPTHRLPKDHLQIYTWQSCTLSELCSLLLGAIPDLLPKPYAGTRIAFRLVYGDMNGPNRPGAPARFLSRDLGSVVIGAQTGSERDEAEEEGPRTVEVSEALKQLDGEPDRTLGDAKFVIGDYTAAYKLRRRLHRLDLREEVHRRAMHTEAEEGEVGIMRTDTAGEEAETTDSEGEEAEAEADSMKGGMLAEFHPVNGVEAKRLRTGSPGSRDFGEEDVRVDADAAEGDGRLNLEAT